MKKSIAIVSLLFLTACSAKLITPTQTDADRVAQRMPGTTLADLQEGRALYQSKCSQCHGLKKPSSKTESEWQQIIPIMAKRAEKAHKDLITGHDQEQIMKYLTAYAKQG
jgi:mono/diheme cytochrome c family protein